MVELTVADVEQYTGRRLSAAAPETARLLASALQAVRRYCGWRVTPAAVETIVLDGPGGRVLSLPTLRLVELQSVSEDGVALDLDDLHVSLAGLVRKRGGGRWSCDYSAIEVVMEHGFDDAPDWQSAVLDMVDRMSGMAGTVIGSAGPLIERTVDDVTYRWANTVGDPASQGLFDLINHGLVDSYRLEPVA